MSARHRGPSPPSGRSGRLLSAAVTGYLLGMVPSADIASRVIAGGSVDLRSVGSFNPGGMNALRVLGRRAGVAVAAADIAKGAFACLAGRALAGDTGAHTAGIAAVTGHCYPVLADCRTSGARGRRSCSRWPTLRRPL